jgi:hypothetical protein
MKQAGAVVLFRFLQTNLEINKPKHADNAIRKV